VTAKICAEWQASLAVASWAASLRAVATAVGILLAAGCSPAARPDLAEAEADARWMLEYYVAALQESYRAAHGHFASQYSALFDPGARITSAALGRARPGLSVRIGDADADGWSAAASLPGVPGAVCVLNVGEPPSSLAVPGRPARTESQGEVVCAGLRR
jgi:hypothetical protein